MLPLIGVIRLTGSVVIYDECQQPHFYILRLQRGAVDDERLTAMETHRHSGHDLIFITQAPTFLHHHARKLVVSIFICTGVAAQKLLLVMNGLMFVIIPTIGANRSGRIFKAFPFNKAHFELYQVQARFHTHKFKIPRKLIIRVGFSFCRLLLFLVYLGYDSFLVTGEFNKPKESPPAQVQARAAAVPLYSWSAAPAIPVAGCIANLDRSRCPVFGTRVLTLI